MAKKTNKIKRDLIYPGGTQLKLAATHPYDLIVDILVEYQSEADRYYSKKTLRKSVELRKVLRKVELACKQERKQILGRRKPVAYSESTSEVTTMSDPAQTSLL